MKKVRKDKNGWYKFSSSLSSVCFINDSLPNILCERLKIVALYPHIIMSGKLSSDKKTFTPDGKIDLGGIKAGAYYKNNIEIKKLLQKEEIE
tara:strand:- start:60 stop:335 length:276 start_codon:yes stop_codon:yes gene_type:complete